MNSGGEIRVSRFSSLSFSLIDNAIEKSEISSNGEMIRLKFSVNSL